MKPPTHPVLSAERIGELKPGTVMRYFDAYNREQLCTVDCIDPDSGRIYVRLKRNGVLVYFDDFERGRLKPLSAPRTEVDGG